MAQAVSHRPLTAEGPGLRLCQSILELWWTKWHRDSFLLRVLRYSSVIIIPPWLSILMYQLEDEQ
jgi:hypothetical protein